MRRPAVLASLLNRDPLAHQLQGTPGADAHRVSRRVAVCAATLAPEPSRERGRHMCSRVWHRACRWSAVGGPQRRAEPPTGATSGTDVQSVVGSCAVMRPRVPRGLWVGVRGCVPTPAVYTRIGVWGSEKIPVFTSV